MEDTGFKALNIAITIIISIAIVSSFILVISEVMKIYKNTNNVNIDLLGYKDEFDMFLDDSINFYYIDIVNVYNKYKNNEFVEVHLETGKKFILDDKNFNNEKTYTAHLIDGNEVLDKYKPYYGNRYKNKIIILFLEDRS